MIRLLDFTGGLNAEAPINKVLDNQLPILENFTLGPGPSLTVAKTFTQDKAIGRTPTALYVYKKKGGIKKIIAVADKYVYDLSGPTIIHTLTSPPSIVNFATWRDKCFIATNTDKLIAYDGTSVVELEETPVGCTFVCLQENRLFLAGEAANPSWVYYSNLGDETKWTDPETYLNNVIEVETNDGTVITGLAPQLGEVTIFKERQMWKIVGSSPNDWSLVRVSSETGCIAPRTIAAIDDQLIFLTQRGVYIAGGDSVTLISKNVEPLIKNADPSTLRATLHGFDYWLYDGDVALIYNLEKGAWSQRVGLGFECMLADGQELYGAKESALYKYDDLNVIYARLVTKEFLGDFPEVEKRFRRLVVQCEVNPSMVLDVSVVIDGVPKDEIFTVRGTSIISLPPDYVGRSVQVLVEGYRELGISDGDTIIESIHIDDQPLRRRYI